MELRINIEYQVLSWYNFISKTPTLVIIFVLQLPFLGLVEKELKIKAKQNKYLKERLNDRFKTHLNDVVFIKNFNCS